MTSRPCQGSREPNRIRLAICSLMRSIQIKRGQWQRKPTRLPCSHVHMYACMYVYIYTHLYTYICTHKYTYTYTYAYAYAYTYTYTYAYTVMYACIYTCGAVELEAGLHKPNLISKTSLIPCMIFTGKLSYEDRPFQLSVPESAPQEASRKHPDPTEYIELVLHTSIRIH